MRRSCSSRTSRCWCGCRGEMRVLGNVFVRCRHLRENETLTTLFRFQFGIGFVKLFKLDLEGNECDLSMEMPSDFHVVLDFLPMDV